MKPAAGLRRGALGLAPLLLLVSGGGFGGACGHAAPRPRSILLVSIDTLRADHLGLYGYSRATSPFLDRLGRESVVFEHAFTSAAWTLIAHMTMLTGLYPEQHGVTERTWALGVEARTLAERMTRLGYQTVALYHPGWIQARFGFDRGFGVFREHANAEQAEQHLYEEFARLDPERPFFVFLHLFDVHSDPTTKVPPSVFSSPPPFQDHFLPDASRRLAGETYDTMKKHGLPPEKVEAMVALYDDGILHVDSVLARCFARLDAEKRLDDALVIVTADHGESLAQRDNWGHGGPWNEGVRVPLILRLPGRARAGERVADVAHLVDVAPTVLDFAGAPRDPTLPGCSLLAHLPAGRVVTGGQDPVQYLVQWPMKLTRAGKRVGAVDLDHDPLEKSPKDASAADFDALRAALALDPSSFHPPLPAGALTPEEKARLAALGYAGEVDGE